MADLGERQSPIDIKTTEAVPVKDDMSNLDYKYDPATVKIVNTGSSWRMDFSSDGTNLTGGPLEGNYKVLLIVDIQGVLKLYPNSIDSANACSLGKERWWWK